MIYSVSIVLTQLVADHRYEQEDGQDSIELTRYYGSLARSMLTLFEAISGGVDWDELVVPLIDDISPFCAVLFVMYIAFCTLAMLNVVTGVFVDWDELVVPLID